METQPARRPTSKGICAFCKTELAKNKVTQHLKFCKQRLASIALEEEKSQEMKTRLFHILAEGEYNPQYWLHFEVPASESLRSLDDFLKDMWIDDLDHLSGFTINGTEYSEEYSDVLFSFSEEEEEEELENLSEEEQKAKIQKLVEEIVSEYASEDESNPDNPLSGDSLSTEWIAEIRKPRSVDELVSFLKEELARITKEDKPAWNSDRNLSPEERRKRFFRSYFQKLVVENLLEAVEDRSVEVSLERILKVGQKFSYIYDFGSSTEINLRVIAEREGIIQNEKEPVQLLAQNTAPTFVCIVCGKPATTVSIGYYGESIAHSVYCTECGNKQVGEDRLLPIINSPRVGVL